VILRTAIPEVSVTFFRRLFAAAGIALVLLLGTATVAPTLHSWLHVDGGHDANHQCAVVLFASGVALAATAIALVGPTLEWGALFVASASELFLVTPRFLRQPERGPPAA
jgi:hypothetical protein